MQNGKARITLEGQGWEFEADDTTPLLLAAERAGIRLPSSCRNGTCRTCICLMRSGGVRYTIAKATSCPAWPSHRAI
jgi:ferredoxin